MEKGLAIREALPIELKQNLPSSGLRNSVSEPNQTSAKFRGSKNDYLHLDFATIFLDLAGRNPHYTNHLSQLDQTALGGADLHLGGLRWAAQEG